MSYKEEIDLNRIPQHVAIIMDGNGRWAKQRGHERSYGHQAGAETVHVIAEEAFIYVLYRELESSVGRGSRLDGIALRLHRGRDVHEEQYQFPGNRRY